MNTYTTRTCVFCRKKKQTEYLYGKTIIWEIRFFGNKLQSVHAF